jgi:preprotein translocase subunit SecG
MYGLVIGLIIFFAVLLVLVILAQNSKGGGLTSQFGGSAASNLIGVKKTGDLLEKLTWGFIIAIIVLSLSTNFIVAPAGGSTNEIFDKASQSAPKSNTTAPAENTPAATDSAK